MRIIITFIFTVSFLTSYSQRSRTPWHNHHNYKPALEKAYKQTMRIQSIDESPKKVERNTFTRTITPTKPVLPTKFVNGMNLAWINFGRDIGVDPFFPKKRYHPDLSRFREAMDFVKERGGTVIRWWYHTNGSTNPVFNPKTKKVAPNPYFFYQDIKKILDLAQNKGLKVQICLWSFDMLKNAWGVNASANKKLITEDEYRNAYIKNALLPLVNFVGDHKALYAWEIFNEPEGMTNKYAKHWPNFKERVEMGDIQKFINKVAGAIRRAQPKVKITNGALSLETNSTLKGFWNAYSDKNLIKQGLDPLGYLDFYNIHYYSWARTKRSPFHIKYKDAGIDKEVIIGEYYAENLAFEKQGGDDDHTRPWVKVKDLGPQLLKNGWAGSFVWSWSGREKLSKVIKETSKFIKSKPLDPVKPPVFRKVIKDQLQPEILYPNPADNYLMVSGVQVGDKINIQGDSGQAVLNTQVQKEGITRKTKTNTFRMDISGLKPGYYFMTLQQGKKIIRKRFLKK